MKLWGYGFRTTICQVSPSLVVVNEYPRCVQRIGIDDVAVGSLSVRISTSAPEGTDSRVCFASMNGYGQRSPRVSITRLVSASGTGMSAAIVVSLR